MPTNEAAAVVVPVALAAFSFCFFIVGFLSAALAVSRTPRFGRSDLLFGIGSMVIGLVGLLVFGRLY